MKIWERYFFFDTLKILLYFLFAFSFIYVLIDYASHTGSFHHHHVRFSFKELALFYSGELIRRSEVLLPFAILVATIRVMTQLNVRNELVALLAAGISMKRLLRPFILIGLLGVAFLYANEEFLIPWSMESSRALGENHSADQSLKAENPSVNHLRLEDGSLLIFQTYHRPDHLFYDVWWVRSIDDIWRIKSLDARAPQTALDIEKFERNAQGAFVSKERIEQKNLPEIRFNQKRLLETLTPPEDLAISELLGKLRSDVSSEKEARIKSAFLRKMILPWLALLVVLAPAPLCIAFSRHLNTFFIYAVSIFGLVFVYILINAATTLADRQVLTPEVALFVPFCMIGLLTVISWFRIK